MSNQSTEQMQDRARAAAVEFASAHAVGDFLNSVDEGENVTTYLFASKLKGYVGWNFSVSIYAEGEDVTISEVNLMPGDGALLAPNWVPWSERLADYKALQAELEAQASEELAAEELAAAEEETSEEEVVVADEATEEEGSATALVNESVDAEQDSDDTGKRPPRFLRRKLGRLKYKKDKS